MDFLKKVRFFYESKIFIILAVYGVFINLGFSDEMHIKAEDRKVDLTLKSSFPELSFITDNTGVRRELGIYRHYKDKLYHVIGSGRHTETGEDFVFTVLCMTIINFGYGLFLCF